jgi:dihydroorotate dehydrogenase (fumarate)
MDRVMKNMSVNYMGLELKNPIIVGACNLSMDEKNLVEMEKAGAAAIVYKSLFEEQVQLEHLELLQQVEEYNERNAEVTRLFPNIAEANPEAYLHNLRKAKKAVSIPIIASLNAIHTETWTEYALKLEEAGADALELNFYYLPREFDKSTQAIEDEQIEAVKKVLATVKIPVSVKLSPYYSNPLNFISRLDNEGVKAFVLFNKLFFPDIDTENEKQHFPYNLSLESDNRLPLQFAGLLYGNIKSEISANSGIYSGKDVVKMLLAGAGTVQVVSTLYKNKIEHITKMLSDVGEWMEKHNYNSIQDFKGKLSRRNMKDPFAYRRAQYVDILFNSGDLLKQYAAR